jgi:hypothetical protein
VSSLRHFSHPNRALKIGAAGCMSEAEPGMEAALSLGAVIKG